MNTFSRITAALLAAVMLASFTACAVTDSGVKGEDTVTTPTQQREENKSPYTDEEIAMYNGYAEDYAKRADVISKATVDNYVDSRLYKRQNTVSLSEVVNITKSGKLTPSGSASVWHYTSFMAMVSRMMAVSESDYYAQLYPDVYTSIKYYEGTTSIITYNGTSQNSMYAVHRASEPGKANIAGVEAVYDDQMWIIRELIYVYNLTGNEDYLEEAVRLTGVCLDGWDTTKDAKGEEIGGICWGPGYQTKHTCSNAPLIVALVDLHDIYEAKGDGEKAEYYLNWAEKVYNFCIKYFLMGNGIYGDLVGSSRELEGSGKKRHYVTTSQSTGLDTSAYTYNTGAMIAGGAALYRVTGEEKYYKQTKKSVKAVTNFFTDAKVLDGYRLWPTGRIWFNLILLEGVLEFYDADPKDCMEVIETFRASLDYGYDNYLQDGFLPNNFLKGWDSKNTKDSAKDVMDQTSCATMYAELSAFYARLAATGEK